MTVTDKEAYESRIDRVLISEEEIKQALKRCGEQISREYEGKPLLLVSVLKGAFVFLADLCREISIPCEIGFMAAQSYFEGTSSRGNVQITYDLAQDLSRYHVIIVEDIIDTGRTLAEIIKLINIRAVLSPWRRTSPCSLSPITSSSATAWTAASITAICRISQSIRSKAHENDL